MKLPEHYKNLDADKKRIVVCNLISELGNKDVQNYLSSFNNDQINFLFTYFFTDSKEKRERMWYDMQKEYKTTLKELKVIAEKLQKLDLKFAELLAEKEDAEEFMRNIK